MAKITLTCKAKDGNAQTQLIPEEATLLCKSSSDTESKVSSPSNSTPQLRRHNTCNLDFLTKEMAVIMRFYLFDEFS